MRIFKHKWFAKFAKKEGISDAKLCQVVRDAESGKIDADYGGGVIKQRIARLNKGKSGGYRSVILYRQGQNAFFVYGFAKHDMENISESEIKDFKILAKVLLSLSSDEIEKLIMTGEYKEISCDG